MRYGFRILAALLVLASAGRSQAQTLPQVSYQEVACLAYIGYTEARGESANVERVADGVAYMRAMDDLRQWGGWNLCDVMRAQGQFEGYGRGVRVTERAAWDRSVSIAYEVVEGRINFGAWRAARYFRDRGVAPSVAGQWLVGCMGNLCFYAPSGRPRYASVPAS